LVGRQPKFKIHTNMDGDVRHCQRAGSRSSDRQSGWAALGQVAHHRHPHRAREVQGLRITLNVYNTLEEIDTFAAAVEASRNRRRE
jgi:selenocysteine lyase/cysteine desulfurase